MSIAPDYKADDFNHMLFSFFAVGDRDVFDCFPILQKYKEFLEPLPGYKINKVIKYIGYCYDKGSPLQKIEDIVKKKVTAALLAGFEPKPDGTFETEVDDMFRCKNNAINLMIIRYCRLVRSRTYILLTVGNETYYNTIKQLMTYTPKGKDSDVLKETTLKMKMLAEAEDLAKKMDALSTELLSGDNSNTLNSILYAVADMTEEEYIKLTPEDFADQWIVDHPQITAKVDGEETPIQLSGS